MMELRVVGAGLGRTGTHSLKLALEQLLGGPCYHMLEVFGRPDDVPRWQRAVDGEPRPWDEILGGYSAAVDWPASAFWRPLSEAYPDAVILLSSRSSADAWYASANETIFEVMRRGGPGDDAWNRMTTDMLRQFTPNLEDAAATKAAYERHNAEVRATAAPERLVDWQPGDGWEPICRALNVPVPDAAFPHVNTTDEFRVMAGLAEPAP
jgi:Sulfotransferase domain